MVTFDPEHHNHISPNTHSKHAINLQLKFNPKKRFAREMYAKAKMCLLYFTCWKKTESVNHMSIQKNNTMFCLFGKCSAFKFLKPPNKYMDHNFGKVGIGSSCQT